MNKIDAYEHNLRQSQFSDEHRDEVESQKLGKSKMSPVVEAAYQQAKKKNLSVARCEWCEEPYPERNSRTKLPICPKCQGGKQAISFYMANHKISRLTPEDRLKIANSRITRFGRNTPQ